MIEALSTDPTGMPARATPDRWITMEQAQQWLSERYMFVEPRFVLDHWDCKYINARIDMRTGAVYLSPGNMHD